MLVPFVLLVGLGAGIASAAVCMLHGWRGWRLLRGRPFQYGIVLIGLPAVLVGTIALVAANPLAGAIAATLGALPGLRFLHSRQKRAALLTAPTAAVVTELVAELRRKQPPSGTTSMVFETSVVSAAQRLVVAGRFDAAAEILGLLAWDLLDGLVLVTAALLLTRSYVESNMFTEGRATLKRAKDKLEEFAGAGEKAEYALLDARLVVHGDRPEKIGRRLARLDELARAQPHVTAEVRVIRMHAMVASGKQEDAMALFGELKREHGEVAVAMLARPAGPATAFAAELARGSAYR